MQLIDGIKLLQNLFDINKFAIFENFATPKIPVGASVPACPFCNIAILVIIKIGFVISQINSLKGGLIIVHNYRGWHCRSALVWLRLSQ
jgi:hypothetical protein